MVDLSGGPEGPIEHAFSNGVFVIPAVIIISFSVGRVLAIENEVVMEHEDAMASGQTQQPHQKVPSPEELLKMLDSMEGLSEKEKEELRGELMNRMSQGDMPPIDEIGDPQMTKPVSGGMFDGSLLVLVGMIGLILAVIVFFSYKLYKSLTERERKREEKKKLKQMKKKK